MAVLTGLLMCAACSGSDDDADPAVVTTDVPAESESVPEATAAATPTSAAPTSTEATITAAPTTTLPATTTTLAPTGSLQACDGFLTLDDPDADGYGECIVTLEDAREQYFVISARSNEVVVRIGQVSRAECPEYLASKQTFVDDLKSAQWPAEVQPQLNELVAASEYYLFILDDSCRSDPALLDEANSRHSNAVFAWRTAVGLGTDF